MVSLTVYDVWLVLQVTETGADLGPGLQAALSSSGAALDKLLTTQIRSPNMYSLVHSSMVRTAARDHAITGAPTTPRRLTLVPGAPENNLMHARAHAG